MIESKGVKKLLKSNERTLLLPKYVKGEETTKDTKKSLY
jgi:hypothetical protein